MCEGIFHDKSVSRCFRAQPPSYQYSKTITFGIQYDNLISRCFLCGRFPHCRVFFIALKGCTGVTENLYLKAPGRKSVEKTHKFLSLKLHKAVKAVHTHKMVILQCNEKK